MQIRMTATAPGADDGFTVRVYEAGQVYPQRGFPVGHDLAQAFLSAGVAVEHVDAVEPDPAEDAPAQAETKPAGRRKPRATA